MRCYLLVPPGEGRSLSSSQFLNSILEKEASVQENPSLGSIFPHCVPASCVKLWAWDLPYEIHTKGERAVFCFLFCFYNTTTNQSHPLMLVKQSRPPTERTEGHCRLNISRPSSLGYQAAENRGPR